MGNGEWGMGNGEWERDRRDARATSVAQTFVSVHFAQAGMPVLLFADGQDARATNGFLEHPQQGESADLNRKPPSFSESSP